MEGEDETQTEMPGRLSDFLTSLRVIVWTREPCVAITVMSYFFEGSKRWVRNQDQNERKGRECTVNLGVTVLQEGEGVVDSVVVLELKVPQDPI